MAFPRNENISMKQGYHKSVFLNYYFSLKGEHECLINKGDHLMEEKITIIKGNNFGTFITAA